MKIDSENNIIKLIYWEGVPIAIGFILFRYAGLGATNNFFDVIKVFFSYLYIIIPIIIAHITIGHRLFKEHNTSANKLANKMMKCKLRRQYGHSYCAKCPDSYTCPTMVE